jgi:hypothetical protein
MSGLKAAAYSSGVSEMKKEKVFGNLLFNGIL